MRRAALGAAIGAAIGILALAAAGAWAGYTDSAGLGRPGVTPGPRAAAIGAFVFTAYYWWLAGALGGLIGGLAAFGSWLVRPRR